MHFWSHLNHSFTHPPPPYPITPSPPSSHHLPHCSNYEQCYTGGSWVRRQTRSSGEWFKFCSSLLTLLLLLHFLLHLAWCLLPCLLVIFTCFLGSCDCPVSLLPKITVWGWNSSGLGSEDAFIVSYRSLQYPFAAMVYKGSHKDQTRQERTCQIPTAKCTTTYFVHCSQTDLHKNQ